MSDEAPFKVTLKGSKQDHPWTIVSADTIEELHDRVEELRRSAFFATLANAAKDMHAAFLLGNQLDAEPMNPPKSTPPKQGPPSAESAGAAVSPWTGEPALVEPEQASKPAEGNTAAPAASSGRPVPKWKR